MNKGWRSLYIHRRWHLVFLAVIVLFVLGVFDELFFVAGVFGLGALLLATLTEIYLLYGLRNSSVEANRTVAGRLSNGDQNPVVLSITNHYTFPVVLEVIDETPVQFQLRNLRWTTRIDTGDESQIKYHIRPVARGAYVFGAIHVYVHTPLMLLMRRYAFDAGQMVKVYPSYLQLRKYAFLALDRRTQLPGIKRTRRIGHTMEFEHIKEYVTGDDTRALNWKASARTGRAMVNQYRDERAQPVYCILDKGRLMQMPFNGLTLLDHAINTSLVMSYIAINRDDNAGLITFAHRIDEVVRAGRRNNQMYRISEALYNQQTEFPEADFERLCTAIPRHVPHRSLLLLFTNFESMSGLQRQLPYLRKIAERHALVVIFFQNTELSNLIDTRAQTLRDIYHQTIAEKAHDEKEAMVSVLRQWGIIGILSKPEDLTVDTINTYLRMKARGSI